MKNPQWSRKIENGGKKSCAILTILSFFYISCLFVCVPIFEHVLNNPYRYLAKFSSALLSIFYHTQFFFFNYGNLYLFILLSINKFVVGVVVLLNFSI